MPEYNFIDPRGVRFADVLMDRKKLETLKEAQAYERERDKISDFLKSGGYDVGQLMAGQREVSVFGDRSAADFQKKLAGASPAARDYEEFKKMMGEKYEDRLSIADRIAFENLTSKHKKELKAQQSGGTKDPYANMGAGVATELFEDETDYTPGSNWNPLNWGKGSPPTKSAVAEEVRLVNGRKAIFDSKTKKFIKWK